MTASLGKIEWQCPYCDTTQSTRRDLQNHITNSAEGEHEGISGESPDRDIVAVDPDTGEELDRHERADVVRPSEAPLEGVSKRKQVVYAWLAGNREERPGAYAQITEADRDYCSNSRADPPRRDHARLLEGP